MEHTLVTLSTSKALALIQLYLQVSNFCQLYSTVILARTSYSHQRKSWE